MEENELVDPPCPDEVSQQAVDGVLHLFLARDAAVALAGGGIEDLEAPDLTGRVWDLFASVKVDRVFEVLGGVSRLFLWTLQKQLGVFLEGEDRPVLGEVG